MEEEELRGKGDVMLIEGGLLIEKCTQAQLLATRLDLVWRQRPTFWKMSFPGLMDVACQMDAVIARMREL